MPFIRETALCVVSGFWKGSSGMARHGVNFPDPVTIWTIYRSPNDHPGAWVLRGHDINCGRGVLPHDFCFIAATLSEVRRKVPAGTQCVGRDGNDSGSIFESWL
jgi:hypothetical protein